MTIDAKARLSMILTITPDNASPKTYNITEGDIVNNLAYRPTGDDKIKTISGIVRRMDYTTVSKTPSVSGQTSIAVCCNPESKFSESVRITSLIVDSSTLYDADMNVVPVNAIVSLESVSVTSIQLTDVKATTSTTVVFKSSVEPDFVMWNGAVCPVKATGEKDEYQIEVTTMLTMNELLVFTDDRFGTASVPGLAPVAEREANITNTIKQNTVTMYSVLADSITSGNIDSLKFRDSFYVPVASGLRAVSEISLVIDGVETKYTKYDKHDYYIYQNNRIRGIQMPVFIMQSPDVLMMAIPFLAVNTKGNSEVTVKANGFVFKVKANPIDAASTLKVSAKAGGGIPGYENTVTESTVDGIQVFEHHRQDATAYVDLSFTDTPEVVDTDVVYMDRITGDVHYYGIVPVSKAKAMYNDIMNMTGGAFVSEDQLKNDSSKYVLNVSGHSNVNFMINTVETIKKTVVSSPEDVAAAIADPTATYIELSGDVAVPAGINVTTAGCVIDGKGHKFTADTLSSNSAAVLVGVNNVVIKDMDIDATGEYAVKLYNNTNCVIENVTAKSATKGAMQINSAKATLRGKIHVDGLWGGIEVCKSPGQDAKPMLIVEADQITSAHPELPSIWIDKVTEDGLQDTVVDTSGILTQMEIPSEVAEKKDQVWYK